MSAARRVLPDEKRRGWCPSLARPMPTGDGLLARVHPPLGTLSLAQARAVAEGARRFGNGHVDVTARGNLQIRGVRAETADGLAAWLAQAGLGDVRGDGGPQRLTLTSPLAGLDPNAAIDVPALARAIEAAGQAIAGLPAKTLVAILGPVVSGEGADIVVRPDRTPDGTDPTPAAARSSHSLPHPEVPAPAGLEGALQRAPRPLEGSFEARLRLAPQDEGQGGRRRRSRAGAAGCTVTLAGGEGVTVPDAEAAETVTAMLRAFAATGRRRVHDLSVSERADLVRAGQNAGRAHLPPPSAGEGGPRVSEGRERGATSPDSAVPAPLPPRIREAPSPTDLGLARDQQAYAEVGQARLRRGGGFSPAAHPPAGLGAIGTLTILAVQTPFGRCTADALDRLAEIAERVAAPDIRTTPARGFLLACGDREVAEAALATLAAAGFITHPDDPRRAVAACPGAPACASGTTPVPGHAAELAAAFAPFAARGLTAHVSGCAKGCAHPAPADLTLVAELGRYAIVPGGGPQDESHDEPATRLTFEAALERVRRADPDAPLAHAFRPRDLKQT